MLKARLAVMRHGKGGYNPLTRFRLLMELTPKRGPRSIFECRAPGRDPVVLKVYSVKHRAVNQFNCLAEASALSDLIAKPLFVDAELGVCAMTFAEGRSVLSRLFGPEHSEALKDAGSWLAQFHRDTHQRRGPVGEIGFDDTLSRQKLRDPSALRNDARRLREHLNARLDGMRDTIVDEVVAHYDYNPKNLHTGPNGSIGFDRPRTGSTAAEIDLGNFLSRIILLTLLRQFAKKEHPTTLPPMETDFVDAYGLSPERMDLLALTVDRYLLQWWMSQIFGVKISRRRAAARELLLNTLLERYGIARDTSTPDPIIKD